MIECLSCGVDDVDSEGACNQCGYAPNIRCHTQDRLVEKDDEGNVTQKGDCYRTAIACLFGLPLKEVPNFIEEELWTNEAREWASARGYVMMEESMKSAFGTKAGWADPFYWVASGTTKRGTHHAVVYCGDKLAWDPHPSRDGLVEVDRATYFVPFQLAPLPHAQALKDVLREAIAHVKECHGCSFPEGASKSPIIRAWERALKMVQRSE